MVIVSLAAAPAMPAGAQERHELVNGQWIEVTPPSRGMPAGELAAIRLMLQTGQNKAAVAAAEKFVKDFPSDADREEVMMLAGLAEMTRDRYLEAYGWFKRQCQEYPRGTFFDRSMKKSFEIAEAFLNGKKRVVAGVLPLSARDEGLDILRQISELVRGSAMGEMAMLRIAQDHLAHGEFPEAALAYDQYLEAYAKSEKSREAALKAAYATHASFRGAQYDPAPLLDAKHRYEEFASQYPQTADKAKVPDIIRQIDSQRAEEDFAAAQLYERTGHPRAAVFYYRSVKAGHAGTEWATKASAALIRLGDQDPPKPPAPVLATPTTQPSPPLAAMPSPAEPEAWSPLPASVPTTITVAAPPAPTTQKTDRKPVDIEPVDLEKLIPTDTEDTAKE